MIDVANLTITKRDGSIEPFDINKLHRVVQFACDGIAGTSASEVEIRSNINFVNKMRTSDIQETLIKSAALLITEETPNYQYVAGRLINYHLRKAIYGQLSPPPLFDHIKKVVDLGFYDPQLLQIYTPEEWAKIDSFIKHDRDYDLTYAAMEQFRGKYLIKNRVTGEILETPQFVFILIAAFLFQRYPKETRLDWVRDFYNALSEFQISLPTPVMSNCRSPQRQYASCVLIDSADSIDSIFASAHAIGRYVTQKAGIGINGGRIRSVGSKVRQGDAFSTGVVPFYRLWQSATKSCSQGSVRDGSTTLHCPIWHAQIEDILVLKNGKGTEENRLRQMDYSIQFNKLMYERLIKGEHITLFSPSDVPDVYDAFFADQEKFRELYERAERNPRLKKKRIPASELFSLFMQERKETGRIYLMNVDHANEHGSWRPQVAPVRMSNLCVTGDTQVQIRKQTGEIQEIAISELAKYANEEVFVWSRDLVSGTDEFKLVLAFAQTSPSAEIMEIEDIDSGTKLRCTPEHLVYTKNRGYVMAKDLREDDILIHTTDHWNIDKRFQLPIKERSLLKITKLTQQESVYDITVAGNENFYANGILVHNCQEITLHVKPIENIDDEHGEIGTCILAAVNWGSIKTPEDFKKPCELLVRALDELIDLQTYPVKAAELFSKKRRALGIGITNFAYWLAKNDLGYQNIDEQGLDTIHRFAEAWSYYLIKASVDLAIEFGHCEKWHETRYSSSVLPIDTAKLDAWELTPNTKLHLMQEWQQLRIQLACHGIRNSTLMALMPCECQHWDNQIVLKDGKAVNLHELAEMAGIDWREKEAFGIPESILLQKPIELFDGHTAYCLNYTGIQELIEIEFEDGNIYKFTPNHLLLVNEKDKQVWKYVGCLDGSEDIVSIKGISAS